MRIGYVPTTFSPPVSVFSDDLCPFQHKISPVEPGEYSERFLSFLKAVMRDGEGGERFKPE